MTKTAELTGAALDWAVAKCEGEPVYSYSTNWLFGGPIIEREIIMLSYDRGWSWDSPWLAEIANTPKQDGETPLIAAMRCYVASKLGADVEVPNELTEGNDHD
jgi:hypothetical protein